MKIKISSNYKLSFLGIMKKTLVFLLLLTLICSQKALGLARMNQEGRDQDSNVGTCAKYTSDQESCLECVPHYHLFEGQCYIDIHGCTQYVFGNICRKCEHGFILVNNECCDRHCMSKIFQGYQAAAELQELTEEKKVEKLITEGYATTTQALNVFRYQFVKFSLASTSNQILQGYIRYHIKIIANDKPYRCIADFEIDTKKVFILEFKLEADFAIKQVTLSQQDVISNEQARIALQFASGKFGLKTYGSSLEKVSSTAYKYGVQIRLFYIGSQIVYIIHVVVPLGNKKQSPYSPWSEQKKDVQAIKQNIKKTMDVIKMQTKPEFQMIKQKISETTSTTVEKIQIKTIQQMRPNVFKYTYTDTNTNRQFQQTSKINSKTKQIQIVDRKQVIRQDVKNIKLPESPQKKIISKENVPQTIQVKQVIQYLEKVQPSLANKQIVNAVVEKIGENTKVTLIQRKNDQVTNVVVISNQRTKESTLMAQGQVSTTPPKETVYTTTPQGKPKIISTDVPKFRAVDKQVDNVITKLEQKFQFVKVQKIQSFEKTEGNMVNTYEVVVKGDKPEEPSKQIRVIQDQKTNQIKVLNVEQPQRPAFVQPIKRQPTPIPEKEYKAPQVKQIIKQLMKTKPQLQDTDVVIKKAEVEQTKFVNQYTVTVQTKTGQTITVKANKPHQQTKPEIISVKPVYQKPVEPTKIEKTYILKQTVNEVTGVKVVTSSKPEDIKQSFVVKELPTLTTTKKQPKLEQIQSLVRTEYEKTITETIVFKEQHKYVQLTVEKNKQTNKVKKVSEQVIQPVVEESKPVLPQTSTTQISQTTFNQIVKVDQVLQKVTQKVVKQQPVLKDVIPVATEVQNRGPVQVFTFVYENKQTTERQRIVSEYNTQTQETFVKEQTPLPKTIPKVNFEKDRTPEGDVKVVTNSFEQIKKQDVHITKVVSQLQEKLPFIKDETPVRYEVVSNPATPTINNYRITYEDKETKMPTTVSLNFNTVQQRTVINDIQQQTKPETPRPIQRPVVVIKPEQATQPVVKNVVKLVEKTVNTEQVYEIKQTKNTLSTCYEVVIKSPEGINKTVTVMVDKNNPQDQTIIDISQPQKPQPEKPVPQTSTPSYTKVVTDSANVKDTTTNDQTFIGSNKYLSIIVQEAERQQPLLKGKKVMCVTVDQFDEVTQFVYLVQVNSKTVRVSGLVWRATEKVSLLEVPSETETGLTQSAYDSCTDRVSTITVLTKQTIETMSKTDKQTGVVASYVKQQFSVDTIEKMFVERFTQKIRYVMIVTISKKVYRIVIVYTIKTSKFEIIERPNITLEKVKPVVLEQRVEPDGTKVASSNTVETIKTVDERVEKFIKNLNQQVPIEPTQITSIVSKQGTHINEYTIKYKSQTSTNEVTVKGILKKNDNSVILQQIEEKPQPLIAPLVRPQQKVPKEEYTSQKITNIIQEINTNKKVPNVTSEKIKDIVMISSTPITTEYKVITQKKEQFVVTQKSGKLGVTDYRPPKPEHPRPAEPAPTKTEYTVNPLSGVETLVTNDQTIIQQSRPIQSIYQKVIQEKTVTKNTKVISAVSKTSDNKVQTTVTMENPDQPEKKIVAIGIFDKKTQKSVLIEKKVVEQQPTQYVVSPQQEVIQTVYTPTVLKKSIEQDEVIKKIVELVSQSHKEVKNSLPTQIITDQLGSKIISTVTYENVSSIVVYDKTTGEVTEVNHEKNPKDIKPLVYETQKSPEGTTIITTNSVEKIIDTKKNFHSIVSEVKQSNPSIRTQNIQGIRIEKPEEPQAPQKITIVFETEKKNQYNQVTLISHNNTNTIIDSLTFSKNQIPTTPEPVFPVKLSPKQIRENNVEKIIKSNIQQLPIKSVKQIIQVTEVKTAYTKTLETTVEDTQGNIYVVKTQQQPGQQKPKILDYVQVQEQKKPEVFTMTSTNSKSGIISTYTNDVKVMTEEKTFNKCLDMLENKKQLSKDGFVVDSNSISRLQRSIEHNIRFINAETKEAKDFRILADSRTGQCTINQESTVSFADKPLPKVTAQKNYIEILKPQLSEAKIKYEFLDRCLEVIRKADYTFENKEPERTLIKQYPIQEGSNFPGAVEVVMIFSMNIGGVPRKTRVVSLGERKTQTQTQTPTATPSYLMKIIDITSMSDEIKPIRTQIVKDEYDRKTTTTSDIKTLQQNSQQYRKVVEQLKDKIQPLKSADVEFVVIKEMKNANQYTIINKKQNQIIQSIVTIDKKTQQVTVAEFKTQSPKVQLEKVPIRQPQAMVSELPKSTIAEPTFIALRQQVISQRGLPDDNQITSIKLQKRPKTDTYEVEFKNSENKVTKVHVFKNTDETFTIIDVKPERPVEQQPQRPVEQPKPSKTEQKIDQVTGKHILQTNDQKIIKESPVINSVMNKITEQKQISRTSKIVQATTKTSETKVQTTIVVQQPDRPQEVKVFVAFSDRENPEDTKIISDETIETTEQINTVQTIEEVVITQTVYKTVIKKDTHLQKIVKAVENKYDDVKDVIPTRITIKQVGRKSLHEVSTEKTTFIVVSNTETEEVETIQKETIPEKITPGSLQTTITDDGRKITTVDNPVILQQRQPELKEVFKTITEEIKSEDIKTVVYEQTKFNKKFTVVSENEQGRVQTVYLTDKTTLQTTNMGTQQLPVAPQKPVSQPEPVKNIPQTKWETNQVRHVIQQVTQVVKQQKVTRVEQLKQTPTTKFYQVTVDTPNGPEVVKVMVDKQTKKPQVIEQKPQKPVEQTKPTPQQPSETTVRVDSTTGVKQTTTTDISVIRTDQVTKKVYETIIEKVPELKRPEIVSTSKKQYDDIVEQKVIVRSENVHTQFVTVVNKKTDTVKILDKSTVDSTQTTSSQLKVTPVTFQEVYDRDEVLRKAVQFVGRRYPQFKTDKPEKVNIEQLTKYIKFTFIYTQQTKTFRIVVIYDRETKSFDVVEEPSQVLSTKPIMFETTKTEQGRQNYFTNDVELLKKADKNSRDMIDQLMKEVKIKEEDIASIQSTKTSTGNVYAITVMKNNQKVQFDTIYTQETKTIKLNGAETVKEPVVAPTPRESVTVPQSQITKDDDVELIRQKSTKEFNIQKFAPEDIIKVEKSKTTVGTQYVISIKKVTGVATLTASVSFDRKVTVISYTAPRTEQPERPLSTTEAPSRTQITYDTTSGSKIQTTNDLNVIKQSTVVRNVVNELVKSESLPKDSEVLSVKTQDNTDTIKTVMFVKTSETDSRVVVTVTNKNTNQVVKIAEKPVVKEPLKTEKQPEVVDIVPQTVISKTLFEEVHKKDTVLQQVITQVRNNHPEIQSTKPQRVTVEKFDDNTVTQVTYKEVTITVVSNTKTGKHEEVSSSPVPKQTDKKPVTLETKVTEDGTKIVTSNTVEEITKIVPTIQPALAEVIKVVPTIKKEQITTISSIAEEKTYTVVTVDKQSGALQEVKFRYQPQKERPVTLVDVQEFSQPSIPSKPKEVVYEPVKPEEKPEIVTAVEKLNKTSTIFKNEVTQIVKIEKSVSNIVETYKVEVKTPTEQVATLTYLITPDSTVPTLVDTIRYKPTQEQPKVTKVEEKIDPITQVKQTTYPTKQTFKDDQTYEKVKNYLKNEINQGYDISSVLKVTYGDNHEISVLLKSEEKSPQQIKININEFNNEIITLQNKTIVSHQQQSSILSQDQPKPSEVKLSPVDQQRFELRSKIQAVKESPEYKPLPEIRVLEKNEIFNKVDEELKKKYETVLKQSNVVHVTVKQDYDLSTYNVYYSSGTGDNKQVYQANFKINPITQTYEIKQFNKVEGQKPVKSTLNLESDIAFGYEKLENFSTDQKFKFVLSQLKGHYPILENSVIQSVQILSLCNGRHNYRVFFKRGLEIVKYIVFYEEAFKRCVFLQQSSVAIGGQDFEGIPQSEIQNEQYFKPINQVIKEENSAIDERAVITLLNKKQLGQFARYQSMYSVEGKLYHVQATIDKNTLEVSNVTVNHLVAVPLKQNTAKASQDRATQLGIGELSKNSNFEKIHKQVLSREGSALQNAQLLGAMQESKPFSTTITLYFLMRGVYYKIQGEIETATGKVQLQELQKVSLDSGYVMDNNNEPSSSSQEAISFAKKSNPDLNLGVIVESSRKKEIFGEIRKLVFKLQTKYYTMIIYKQGNQMKVLSQSESTSLESTVPGVKSFPRPSKNRDVVLNRS